MAEIFDILGVSSITRLYPLYGCTTSLSLPQQTSSLHSTSLMAECRSSSTVEPPPSLLVFSDGTGFNGVVEELKKLTTRVAHVLPVSDDGGSTAEIVRVLGGPAVGDIRSRCLRLSDESTSGHFLLGGYSAIAYLLMHTRPRKIGTILWKAIIPCGMVYQDPYSEIIRAFLIYFQNEADLMRDFASVMEANSRSFSWLELKGARIFFQSLDAANFSVFTRFRDSLRQFGPPSDINK